VDLVWTLVVVALLTETLLYFAVPQLYARAARFPFGPSRRVIIHPRALEALRAPAPEGAGYRQSAAGVIDLARLELPRELEMDGLVLHFHLDRKMAIARLPYTGSRRSFGILRVDIVPTNGALELRPRFTILGWASLIALSPLAVGAVVVSSRPSEWPGSFVFGALFIGINVVFGLLFGKPRLEAGLWEIERQIEAALLQAETAGC
jgi:hypothetical protein